MSVWRYEKSQIITSRMVLLALIFGLMGLVIIGRLFYLQVLQGEKYRLLADKNRISNRLTLPQRGILYDNTGRKLAENRKNFQAVLIREDTPDYHKTLEDFARIVPLDETELKRIEKETQRKKAFMPIRIKENLTFEEVAALQVHAPDLPGIQIEAGLMRFYPFGDVSAPAVGYVSLVNDQDDLFDANDPFMELAGYRIGRTGLEQSLEHRLRGVPGLTKKEVNAFGRSVRVLEEMKPFPGEDIQLTLSAELQAFAVKAMGQEAGSVIVMDVDTGALLAFVSTPTYDANLFTTPLSHKDWNRLIRDKKRPLQNKALTGTYSPGSIFKLVVALAGLESGDIQAHTQVNCTGQTKLNDHVFHCWKRHGHGPMTLQSALMHSCDVYFYEMAQKIGPEKIIDVARRLGFGSLTGIELAGEKSGLLPTPAWKLEKRGDAWRTGDTLNLSIGQGFLNVTPLQLVTAVAQIAGGKRLQPHLVAPESQTVRSQDEADQQQTQTRVTEEPFFKKAHLDLVRQGMYDVVNKKNGTAYGVRFDVNGVKMAGKTASTQVRRITMKEREEGIKSQDELPWEYRDHAIFAAYAPTDKPRFAVLVFVEHGGGGARTAAPIASKILRETIRLYLTH